MARTKKSTFKIVEMDKGLEIVSNNTEIKSKKDKKIKFQFLLKQLEKKVVLKENQLICSKKIENNTITFIWGAPGTSKSFTSCYTLLKLLFQEKIEKIIFTKPIKESGENLGFLPGDVDQKIQPYVESFLYVCKEMIGEDNVNFLIENKFIEMRPLAYMRGCAQPLDAKVLTPNGFINMGEIKINDEIINSKGEISNVIDVFPQGIKKVYKIEFSDETFVECCGEHLWYVKETNGGWKIKNTLQLISEGLKNKHGQKKWKIPMLKAPVNFKEKENLKVDPYLLGLLLGDGCMRNESLSFTTNDEELRNYIEEILDGTLTLKKMNKYDYRIVPYVRYKKNTLKRKLKEIKVYGHKSPYKFIPEEYLYSSVENRISLLRGLMDTDGSIYNDHSGKFRKTSSVTHFYSTSKMLIDQVKFLVESLGGTAKIRSKIPKSCELKNKSTQRLIIGRKTNYDLSIRLPQIINPFKLKRKKALFEVKENPVRLITNIVEIGEKECQCIKVSAEDSLYITNNFIVTHNTYSNCGLFIDELQNGLFNQIILYITRLGQGSKMVLAGDISQRDIEKKQVVFHEFIDFLKDVEGIGMHQFGREDIVRHPILIEITERYEKWKESKGL